MEKTLAKERQAWKTLKSAFPTFPQLQQQPPVTELNQVVVSSRERKQGARHFEKYGPDPTRRDYLDDLESLKRLTEQYLPITVDQINNPKTIPRWQAPSRLLNRNTASKSFLVFLHTWLYDDTSAQAHLNAAGLSQIGGFVLSELAPESTKKQIEERTIQQYIYLHFTRTLIVALAIATEVDAYRKFANKEAIQRLWVLLAGLVVEARDVYEQRYAAMLK